MTEKSSIQPFYQARAKDFIDSMFDAKIFAPHITRDIMNGYEDLLASLLQSDGEQKFKIIEMNWRLKNLD